MIFVKKKGNHKVLTDGKDDEISVREFKQSRKRAKAKRRQQPKLVIPSKRNH